MTGTARHDSVHSAGCNCSIRRTRIVFCGILSVLLIFFASLFIPCANGEDGGVQAGQPAPALLDFSSGVPAVRGNVPADGESYVSNSDGDESALALQRHHGRDLSSVLNRTAQRLSLRHSSRTGGVCRVLLQHINIVSGGLAEYVLSPISGTHSQYTLKRAERSCFQSVLKKALPTRAGPLC